MGLTRKSPFLGNAASSFHGSTSYTATLFESQQAVENDGDELMGNDMASNHQDLPWTSLSYTPDRLSQIRRGAACLAILQDMSMLEPLVRIWYQQSNIFHLSAPWVPLCIDALKEQIYAKLRGLYNEERENLLMELSAHIFQNTLKPLEAGKGDSPLEFARSWITESLRWEAVAAFLTAAGITSMVLYHDWNNVSGARELQRPEPQMAKRMLDASQVCLSFCEEAGQLSDPELWVMADNTFLSSVVDGDASNITWRLIGDLVSAVLARGLHHEIASGITDPDVPAWMAEMRKRAFVSAYSEDKGVSAFIGRPPRLHRRYCSMQAPLCLDLKNLLNPDFDLEGLKVDLNQEGWNLKAGMGRCNLLRASMTINELREDILDFSLANTPAVSNQTVDLETRAADIIRRSEESWDSLPSTMRDHSDRRSEEDSWATLTVRLNFLYNAILLQRAMMRKIPQHPNHDLLRLSREALTDLLYLLQPSQMALSGYRSISAPWLLAKYGLPAAGVLCMELLHERRQVQRRQRIPPQSHDPSALDFSTDPLHTVLAIPPASNRTTPTTNPTTTSSYSFGLGLHRSESIQLLSRLASRLRWAVTKIHGNYTICNQSRILIQHILDQVLNPPALPTAHPHNLTGTFPPPPLAAPQTDPKDLGENSDEPSAMGGIETHSTSCPGWSEGQLTTMSSEPEFWGKWLPNHPLLK